MVPRSAEQCRAVPSSAGKGWGRHWGAFKLLYYHCNTTKIDRVEQPRTVCGGEECRECRVVPGRGGADIGATEDGLWCRGVVPGRGGADIGEPLNYSTTIAIPLK